MEITCPYCWESITVERPEYNGQEVAYTVDCEVCCRPIRIVVAWEPGEDEPFVSVEAES